ncbi:29667_t:CDS:2 [Gigaspora margarita]|uniref:29667_t:CDS:1 n=1 Tax=Gigaspora margarita TaxID=4874 RepID=A0ABN7UIH6_GIGMA|nr:29667_t:CDS:2 [Gigaspora margarita]
MFTENRFEIYTTHELVEIELPEKTEIEKAAETRCLAIYELIERTHNAYWRIEKEEDMGRKSAFVYGLVKEMGKDSDGDNIMRAAMNRTEVHDPRKKNRVS